MDYEVLYNSHAAQRMVLRGISRSEVEEAIRVGAKSRQDGKVVAVYRYFEVVYVVRGSRIYVITVKPRW
jgi:hypothetical protein